MKTLRWIRALVVNVFVDSKTSGLRRTTIILRRVLAVAFLFMFVGALISYASDGLEFIKAAEKGDISKVTNLLAQEADVNAKDNHGITALMMASGKGHSEIVQILLGKGADVNAKRSDGFTALMISSFGGDSEIVQLLKKAGAKE